MNKLLPIILAPIIAHSAASEAPSTPTGSGVKRGRNDYTSSLPYERSKSPPKLIRPIAIRPKPIKPTPRVPQLDIDAVIALDFSSMALSAPRSPVGFTIQESIINSIIEESHRLAQAIPAAERTAERPMDEAEVKRLREQASPGIWVK